jgi:hypothetical protein
VIAVVEARLDPVGEHYHDGAALRTDLGRLDADLGPGRVAHLVARLCYALLTDRHDEAIALVEARLHPLGERYGDGAALRQTLQRLDTDLGPPNVADLVRHLSYTLLRRGRYDEAINLVEARLDPLGEHYHDGAALRQTIQQLDPVLGPLLVADLVRHLSSIFLWRGRYDEAIDLVEARLGLTLQGDHDPQPLGQILGELDQAFGFTILVDDLIRVLRVALLETDKLTEAAALVAARLGLSGEDFRGSRALNDALLARDQELDPRDASFLSRIGAALDSMGGEREAEAVILINSYINCFPWIDRHLMGANVLRLFGHISRWIRADAEVQLQFVVDVCRVVVSRLRQYLNREGLAPADRVQLVRMWAELRQSIAFTGHLWAGAAATPEEADRRRKEALFWDAELANRSLVERFLLAPGLAAATAETSLPPEWASESRAAWPFRRRPQPTWSGHLCPVRPDEPSGGAFAFGMASLSWEHSSAPLLFQVPQDQRPEWLQYAERFVALPLDEGAMACQLGSHTLLLRAGFTPEGALIWSAWHSDGQGLALVADDQYRDRREDRHDLAWAVAEHDFRIALAYLEPEQRLQVKKAFELALSIGDGRPDSVITRFSSRESFADELHKRLDNLAGDLTRIVPPSGADRESMMASRLRACFGPVPPEDPAQRAAWARGVADRWRVILDRTRAAADPDFRPLDKINEATHDFIEAIAQVWDLSPLQAALRNLPRVSLGIDDGDDRRSWEVANVDVVVQVENVLHGMPAAALLVGNQPLWQQVRSVRSTLSVLLDTLQRETELQAHEREPHPRRLMTMSGIREDRSDSTINGAIILHHGQRNLARAPLEWLGAATRPPGTGATLKQALGLGPCLAATLCGHGDGSKAEVLLADDSPWKGAGLDLGLVEFLMLVSCSIGRVRETGVPDVEGFCVELAVHRARSVLACTWLVESIQAANAANEVLAQYLRLRRAWEADPDQSSFGDARLRARALNLARKLLTDSPPGRESYLNTLSAFVLYGLA